MPDPTQIQTLYRTGMSCAEVGLALGCGKGFAYRTLRRSGETFRRQTPSRIRTKPKFSFPGPARAIIMETAADHNISYDDLRGPLKHRRYAWARFDAMTRLRAYVRPFGLSPFSLQHIAFMLGRTDHTAVINGLRQWKKIQAEAIG